MFRSTVFALLLFAAPAFCQVGPPTPEPPLNPPVLVLPTTVNTPVNFPVAIRPTTNEGGLIRWMIADPGLREYDLTQLLEPELALKATSRMFWSPTPGRYRVFAVTAKGDLTSAFAITTIIVGDVPDPGPNPGPNPDPTPTPDQQSPFKGDGLRVLIVFHRADLNKYPSGQVAAMNGRDVQEYLSSVCTKGADGVTPEWRIWNDEADPTSEPQLWKDAFKIKRDKMPWIYVGNGKTGYSGPLPLTAKDINALVAKYSSGPKIISR